VRPCHAVQPSCAAWPAKRHAMVQGFVAELYFDAPCVCIAPPAADVNGALRAGLAAAVWINRNGERPVPTGLRPAAILSSVLELPSALEQLQLLPQQEA